MKRTITPLLSLAFSLLLVGACAPQSNTGDSAGGDNLSLLSNGPNLPDECNVCWDDFQDCFAQGNDLATCAQQIVECVDACQAPPPPPECLHCAAGFEACATSAEANGNGAEDCAIGFEGCLSACESDTACQQDPSSCLPPTPVDECGACGEQFQECINDGWQSGNQDPSGIAHECDANLQQCLQGCIGLPPGPTDDFCQHVAQECANDQGGVVTLPDGMAVSCQEALAVCQGPVNPPPSDSGAQCDFCQSTLDQCDTLPNGNSDCAQLQEYCSQVCP